MLLIIISSLFLINSTVSAASTSPREKAIMAVLESSDFTGENITLNQEPFGEKIAKKVADKLETRVLLINVHPGYCGTALALDGKDFVYTDQVQDGQIHHVTQRFSSKTEFIKWLAAQSDDSLKNCDQTLSKSLQCRNQTITKQRLIDFVN